MQAWGVCNDRPKLPASGFDYDVDALKRMLSLSYPALFSENPGCGSAPLVVRGNTAGRHGGGLFKHGCDDGLEQKELCWVGGVSEGASPSFILAFESNSAGAAGGGIYTSCFHLGKCQPVFQKTIGLPTEGGQAGKVYSFSSNRASGYGKEIATAPTELVIIHAVNQYVPGASYLDISFSLLDAQGQSVVGSLEAEISHLLQLLVVPVRTACTTIASCDQFKLQPTESFLSTGKKETTSLLDLTPIRLQYCQVGVEGVEVRLFTISGDELDVGDASQSGDGLRQLARLQRSIPITCRPCDPGWMRRETDDGLWTCVACTREQYVVDPNKHYCQPCPTGGTCLDGSFTPSPADSKWNSTVSGVYRLTSCPPGHVLIRDESSPVLDRCVACAPDTYTVEEAVFGEQLWDRSVENYNQYCHPCPRSRATCSGANDVRPLAGAPLML